MSILALSTRFVSGDMASQIADRPCFVVDYTNSARELVMHRVTHGPVQLSTIQALCILSLVEFNDGNTPRASTYSSLAMDLSLSAGLSSEQPRSLPDQIYEERRRCYWSVVLLKNLYGFPSGSFSFLSNERTPKVPQSPDPPLGTSSQMTDSALEQPEGPNNASEPSDLGIVAYAIQLSEVWQRAARYAHRRGKPDNLPAWSTQSEYSQIMAQLMDLETRLPYKYRFRPAKFADQDSDQLKKHRSFWAAWVQLQILYHTILCLLNHPLLLSLRLRSFRLTMVPEVFLQHTADLTTTHTEWVTHLINLCQQKEFTLSDPFLAHCAAAAATIYLQQSYSDDPGVRATKKDHFRTCVSFVRDMGSYWPYIHQLADKIESFENVVSTSFYNAAARNTPDSHVFIDLSLFWDIIESSFVSELPKAADSYFGPSLTLHRQASYSAEVLRSRLLPEPTRLNHEGVTRMLEDHEAVSSTHVPNPAQNSADISATEFAPPPDDEVAILAQNYFAQGQDFVGSMDDWWFSGQPG
ncbi:uncharacterized protein Z518_05844 [Rhinocladiella mackenziei CBS 650.93]|uniref:Xylanolytic transcriptional activator regulatory domain-containing protein n=1 Tax=Rhinocladiella mackenziei CBS 650.93 TaxID=1442369 RepID=A0A0D2FS62_9EURO|nr:uncharacterized protein Z518_05844 [Rhinocladiella mackenziei CBS 650.93]KIX04972.1 hypothetical protein Z518_05844 [Rhinocladiella mackenziei CBS 650.93]